MKPVLTAATMVLASFLAEPVLAGPLTGQTLQVNSNFSVTPTTAVVGSSVEFIDDFGDINFDFTEDGLLNISFVRGGGSHEFIGDFYAEFLDFNHTISNIIGFTLLSVDTDITGVEQADLSFTADSVRFNIGDTFWSGVNTTASFKIDFRQTAVPEPTTLALLGIGAVGWFSRRRLRSNPSV